MAHIKAPFTEEQIAMLKQWQSGLIPATPEYKKSVGDLSYLMMPEGMQPVHPFTCGDESCNRSEHADEGVLIPTKEGWVCPCGKYKQDWCHDYMINNKIEDNEQQPTTSEE